MAKTAADLVVEARAQVKSLTPQEAFDEATSGRAVLLDVREPVEWEHHIEGALQIPRGLLEFQADPTSPRYNAGLDPTRPVIVYCRSGAGPCWPRSRCRPWATHMSPIWRGASMPGKRLAFPPLNITKVSERKETTMTQTIIQGKTVKTVALNWNEVWFTNCPMVSANNVDQELGWCREEYKKIGVEYAYFRHSPDNDWYPHYIHNLDNLIRFGGLYPPIHVNADLRRTRLLGATWVYEGGCMAVRARDRIFRMQDLKGKKVGISKSLNTLKNDWWRIQEHMGIENMLKLNSMTMDDIEWSSSRTRTTGTTSPRCCKYR